YSAYLSAQQVKQYDPSPSPGGHGMILSKVSGYAYVVGVLKGSPADVAGIKEGDFIEYVGKVPSRDLSLYDIENLVRGQPGTQIQLRIVHQGQSRKVAITLAKVGQPAIESRMEEPGIGYIKVTSLADGKSAEIKRQLADLTAKGAQKIALDLRDAANGKLEEGVAVANMFVGSGTLAKMVGKQGADTKSYTADPSKVVFTGPLTVVIDHSTAGPGEIIAAAVREEKRGDVVGERTFDMGSDQKLFPLADGGALLITVAKYAPASGKPFMDEGVEPTVKVERPVDTDIVVPDNEDDETPDDTEPAQPPQPKVEPTPSQPVEDIQLKKAIELLKQAPASKAAAAQKRAALMRGTGSRQVAERKLAA